MLAGLDDTKGPSEMFTFDRNRERDTMHARRRTGRDGCAGTRCSAAGWNARMRRAV